MQTSDLSAKADMAKLQNGAMSVLRIIRGAAVVSVGALVTAVIIYFLLSPTAKQQTVSVSIGGPFELVDQDGIRVTDKTFAGKPSVIFFGYTSCPDVCPTTLFNLSTWLKAIGPDADKLKSATNQSSGSPIFNLYCNSRRMNGTAPHPMPIILRYAGLRTLSHAFEAGSVHCAIAMRIH